MANIKFDVSETTYPDHYEVYKSYVKIDSVFYYRENFKRFFFDLEKNIALERDFKNFHEIM